MGPTAWRGRGRAQKSPVPCDPSAHPGQGAEGTPRRKHPCADAGAATRNFVPCRAKLGFWQDCECRLLTTVSKSAGIIHRQRQVVRISVEVLAQDSNPEIPNSPYKEVAMTQISAAPQGSKQADDKNAIRPFRVNIPEADLTELRRRINATKWPERETVTDASQGVQLATIQALARCWGTEYDWRKVEARLNALPQFITEIDRLDIHFIHVRSKHENALPLIVTHGWPGSVLEQMKIIDPLTNPTAHGASASDAFDLVIPSIPGYGYSGKPTTTGWDGPHIARAWVVLMKRLGYTKFVAQGGDWGAVITEQMGVQAAPELMGIHI